MFLIKLILFYFWRTDILQIYLSGIPFIVLIYGVVILFKNRRETVLNAVIVFYLMAMMITAYLLIFLGSMMKKSTFRELFILNFFLPLYFILAFNRIVFLSIRDFCSSLGVDLGDCKCLIGFYFQFYALKLTKIFL